MVNSQQAQLEATRAVEEMLEKMKQGFTNRDAELLSSPEFYYSEDGSKDQYVLFDAIPPFMDIGVKALREKYEQFIDVTDGPVDIHWTDKHIDGNDTFAFFRGVHHVKFKYKDGRNLKYSVRHTLVLKKFNGKYMIIHEHASLPDAAVGIETPT